MPSALPGISAGKMMQLLQQTDRLIKSVPEVASVFGKPVTRGLPASSGALECNALQSVLLRRDDDAGRNRRPGWDRRYKARSEPRL